MYQEFLNIDKLCMMKEDYKNAVNYINEIKELITSPRLDYLLGLVF